MARGLTGSLIDLSYGTDGCPMGPDGAVDTSGRDAGDPGAIPPQL